MGCGNVVRETIREQGSFPKEKKRQRGKRGAGKRELPSYAYCRSTAEENFL